MLRGRWILALLAVGLTAALAVAGCGGGKSAAPADIAAGDPARGQKSFVGTCAACHGGDARGLPGSGKDLVASEFVKSQTNQQLLDFLKKGRSPSDPLNTTGSDMPAKGGNPALTEQDLLDIIGYIRSIQP